MPSTFQTISDELDRVLPAGDYQRAKELVASQTGICSEWETALLVLRIAVADGIDDEAIALARSCMSTSKEKTAAFLRELALRGAGSGEAAAGLRFLEILHDALPDDQHKKVQSEISSFRVKHGLGEERSRG